MSPKRTVDEPTVTRRAALTSIAGVGAVALAGCTSDGASESGGSESLSGDIRISGSSTVYPVGTAVSELFEEENPDVSFNISKDGSSGGFENVFVPGDSDINNASRPITDEEVQECEDNGFEAIEFQVAQDALTIVVNNENDFLDSITYDELEQIWTPDDSPEQWSDVNSEWPDEPIDLYGPASTSGTFDYFTEEILGETGRIRDDFEGTEEDDQIATGIEGNEFAFGYLPFAYYINNPDTVTALPVSESADDEPVEPSLDAASSGEYSLARPLFFYANSSMVEEKNHLQEFIRFYIEQTTDQELIAEEIGYVPASDDLAEENLATLEEYAGSGE